MVTSSDTSDPRKPVSHRAVWVGLTALAVVLLVVFGAGYWLLVKYEPRALLHLPSDTQAAVRVDVEQVVLYEPIRRHVFPVLDGRLPGGAASEPGRLALFKEASGVNLGMDLREIVVALQPNGDWTVLVGGLFPTSGLPGAIQRVLERSGSGSACSLRAETLVCGGLVMAQAPDGVLVLASNEGVLAQSLTGSDWARRNGLPDTPIAAAIPFGERGSGGVANTLMRAAVMLQYWGVDWLGELRGLTLSTDLGDPLQVQVVLEGLSEAHTEQVRAIVERAQGWAGTNPGPEVAGERGALARLTVEPVGGRPALRTQWPRHDVDRAVARLAEQLRGWLQDARTARE